MKIYFIRHGHAQHNEAFDKIQNKKVYESINYIYSELTEKGVSQIKAIYFDEKIQKVYCSPLKRCYQTARIVFGDSEILYYYDGLMETQGPYPCNYREHYDCFHSTIGKHVLENMSDKYYPSKVHETEIQLKKRAYDTLEKIKKDAFGKKLNTVCVITHNDWLEAIFERPFKNGEVYAVDYEL
jgi:broad specificity phosphatase PhoE